MSNEDVARRLLRQAENYRQQQLYDFAVVEFDKVIELLDKPKDEYSRRLLDWALAHQGESYLQMASKAKSDFGRDCFEKALRCFNKALQVQDDDKKPPKIELAEKDFAKIYNQQHLIKHEYIWTIAHRSETLRALMYQFEIPGYTTRDKLFEAAKASFEKVIKADPDYAWAFAHLGATIINWRGGEKKDYELAVEYLDIAIVLCNLNYPWALIYRAGAYDLLAELTKKELDETITQLQNITQQPNKDISEALSNLAQKINSLLDAQSNSFYPLIMAIIQNNTILTELLDPPTEYGSQLTHSAQFFKELALYVKARGRELMNKVDYLLINYYYTIVWMIKGVPSLGLDIGNPADLLNEYKQKKDTKSYYALAWKRITAESEPALFEDLGDLYLGKLMELPEKMRDKKDEYNALVWSSLASPRGSVHRPPLPTKGLQGEQILTDIVDRINLFIKTTDSDHYKDEIFYMIGGVLARIAYMLQNNEARPILAASRGNFSGAADDLQNDAGNFLKAAYECAKGIDTDKVQKIKERAMSDMAWYGMQKELDKLFRNIEK